MALLDVTEILFDPDFADLFTVTRRAETVGADGRSVVVPTTFENVVGVVTAQSPSSLERGDDGQRMARNVCVVTTFRLRGPANGFQPDQITIEGVVFTVVDVMPFTRFGPGFVEVIATSMNAQNAPPA